MLLDDTRGHHPPTEYELGRWRKLVEQRRDASIQGLEELRKEKEETRGRKDTPEAEKKRRERQEKKALKLAAVAASASSTSDSLAPLLVPDEPTVTTSKDNGYPAHTIIIPGTSEDHPWFRPPEYETLEAAREAGVWTYPTTPIQRARCAVFRDLIEQGYFIGGGMKFGGDWLVYPGALRHYSCMCPCPLKARRLTFTRVVRCR